MRSLNHCRVLVIPGGAFQVPLILKGRARGYHMLCADRSPDCVGRLVADEFHPIGLDQREQLLDLAKSRDVQAIVTDQTDAAVRTVAWLSDQLGVAGIGEKVASLFTRKNLMREFGREHGFPTPRFHWCRTASDAELAARELGYPLVIKPVDNQSSRGVYLVHDAAELVTKLGDVVTFSSQADVLVEEFIDGTEFTVEGFKSPSGHRTLAISEKRHYFERPMVAYSLCYTPTNERFDYDQLRNQNDQWVNQSGLPFGLTHAEYKYRDGKFFLIEIAARGGGTRIASEIVPWVSGVDYQSLLLDVVVERKHVTVPEQILERCALLEFFQFPAGRITNITGVDEAKSLYGVLDINLNCHVGGTIRSVSDDTTRPGYFILLTETDDELQQVRRQVLETIRVTVSTDHGR